MTGLTAGVYSCTVSRAKPLAVGRRGLTLTLRTGPAKTLTDIHIPFDRIADLMVVLGADSLTKILDRDAELACDRVGAPVAISGPGGTYRI